MHSQERCLGDLRAAAELVRLPVPARRHRADDNRCVYVCMCVYIYICIHTCIYICVYIYIYIYMHTYIHTYTGEKACKNRSIYVNLEITVSSHLCNTCCVS